MDICRINRLYIPHFFNINTKNVFTGKDNRFLVGIQMTEWRIFLHTGRGTGAAGENEKPSGRFDILLLLLLLCLI